MDVKNIYCDDCEWRATGTYTGSIRKSDELQIGDDAELLCKKVTVLVSVDSIEGNDVVGTVRSVEDADNEEWSDIKQGDKVSFKLSNVRDWH